jgi:hypothetical protein
MNLDNQQRTRLAVALGAVVALVLGFAVLNKSDDTATTASAAAQRGPGGQGGPGGGQMTEVTGTAATKAKAAAEAAVDGTADHVIKNPQGSGYLVMVRGSDGTMTMVELSSSYKVTAKRAMQAPPNGGQGGPPGQGGQSGTPPTQPGSTTTQ